MSFFSSSFFISFSASIPITSHGFTKFSGRFLMAPKYRENRHKPDSGISLSVNLSPLCH